MEKGLILERVKIAADQMVANQCMNRLDANHGRTLENYSAVTGQLDMTVSWTTGVFIAAMLGTFKRTGDQKYLEAAEFAGHYILALQEKDQRNARYYGVYHELTPQSVEFCPRDAATAAWAMVWLYEATRNPQYLDSATLYADWMLKYGMYNGWPMWAMFMDEANTRYFASGSFQSGVGLFFYDLFRFTNDQRYIDLGMRPIAERYVKEFFREDGSIILRRDSFTGKEYITQKSSLEGDMHQYNDDFGAQMLMAASDLFEDDKYRDQARKFARWLADAQNADGYFFCGPKHITSAVPISLMYYDELGRFYNDGKLLEAAEKSFAKLLDMQLLDTDNPKLYGYFEGMETTPEETPRLITQMRTNAYAIIALLKVEGKIKDFWLGGEHNAKFVDPLIHYSKTPYPFKW